MDKEFEAALKDRMARLRAAKARISNPRYEGRGRTRDTIKAYCAPSRPQYLTFSVSLDVVTRWLQLRDQDDNAHVHVQNYKTFSVQFTPFDKAGIPAVLMRLEPPAMWARGHRLNRDRKGWRFLTTISAKKIGVRKGITSKKLELLWADHMKGCILIFPEADMRRRNLDVDPATVAEEAQTD